MKFEEQSFVVIGGGKRESIGLNFVKQLLATDIEKIAIFDIVDQTDAIADLKSAFPKNNVLFRKVDVRNKVEIENTFKELINTFGYVDVLANCAAISNESDIEDVINTNLLGVMYGTLTAIEHMSVSKGGRGGMIVNVSSIAGLDPFFCLPAYCASKFGIIGFTRALAHQNLVAELGIKFVMICPGTTITTLYQNVTSNMFGTNGADDISNFAKMHGSQTPEECAKSLLRVLKVSENGSTWILNNREFTEVKFPTYFRTEQ
ncbi:alcohol dehydrogenase 1-like isoform X2 [Contarinia nasturtii]|uniref:alcohol dehydrogenase 1-like isoform X2 n=1 Tax=Contarinia nasturtii TaxID=265458 RepID=UPI0012D4AC01|nr:alcohol dehydrogenase 1-like isoform X2 [Contarinia nasturtii]